MITTRPILFSAPMVRALLAGTKNQTRRIAPISDLNIKPNSNDIVTWGVSFTKPVKSVLGSYSGGHVTEAQARSIIASSFNPYGKAGDRLWVRETLKPWSKDPELFAYAADDAQVKSGHFNYPVRPGRPCIPSIHLPRAWSRITLEITGVRVERLQDISEADAIAEGVDLQPRLAGYDKTTGCQWAPQDPREAYFHLWEAINGPGSWDTNPWVWVIEFERTTQP